jgi:FtsP/CotA-like multicopper oxidase with cupredoxin domain
VLCQHGVTGLNGGGSRVRTVHRAFPGHCDQAGKLNGTHHPHPGKAPLIAAWRDTVNVPVNGILRIARAPPAGPATGCTCHIPEHHAAGMMAHLRVTR